MNVWYRNEKKHFGKKCFFYTPEIRVKGRQGVNNSSGCQGLVTIGHYKEK